MINRILMVLCCVLVGMGAFASACAEEAGRPIEQIYNHIRTDPQRLRVFLRDFPKGSDVHNQLEGAVYAETLLHWAAKDNLCISLNMGKILPSPCGVATHNEQPAALLPKDLTSWSHLIAALSLRDFVPTVGDRSAHDHFFGTYERFAAVEKAHHGELLAEALKEAARNHVSYVEFVLPPLGRSKVSVEGRPKLVQASDLSHVHEELLKALPDLTQRAQKEVADMQAEARKLLLCDEKIENSDSGRPACKIEVRYFFQASRNSAPIMVFTELEMGYLLARNNPLFVGVTLTGPEDAPEALADYMLQMEMFHFLNGLYKNVKLALPAGELTSTLVPPENLSFHIDAAVNYAGAKRVAQGLDMIDEENKTDLLQAMARHSIALELNLTRNETLTGLEGQDHPFTLYRQSGVPVVLTSDNGGIFRKDLTEQYVLAAQRYSLSYADLVAMSRNSLEYSFLEGGSLWVNGHLGRRVASCVADPISDHPTKLCKAYLQKNPRARLEWQLEVSLKEFASAEVRNKVLTR